MFLVALFIICALISQKSDNCSEKEPPVNFSIYVCEFILHSMKNPSLSFAFYSFLPYVFERKL